MVPSDKEIIDTLLQACEGLYVQNILLRGFLHRAGVADVHGKLGTAKDSVEASLARANFQKIFALGVRSQQEMREFLEKLPSSGSIQ
jgi:hypothetical protein